MAAVVFICVLAFVLLLVFFYLVPINMWFQCVLNGVKISLIQLIFMRWRKVPPAIIVNAMVNSKKAGLIHLQLSSDVLAHVYVGNVD